MKIKLELWRKESDSSREREGKTSWLGTKESAGLNSYIWEYQCRGGVKQYHELNYDLEITETELKVARSTHKELFGGEEEEAEDSF